MDENKKKIPKLIRNFAFFIILIILTFYFVFKDTNIIEMIYLLGNVKKEYILLALILMVVYILCDAANIGRGLKTLKEKSSFLKNIKYSLIGFFFSGITPAASGGQPMQIYYMKKDGITVANSTLVFLINLTCVQIVTISLAIFSVCINYAYLTVPMIWFFVLGILLNAIALSTLVISISSRRLTKWIINKALRIMRFFRIKNIDEKEENLLKELKTYQIGARYMKLNIPLVLKTLACTYVQFIAFYAISYFVYRAFGLNEFNIFELTTLQAVLYGTTSAIPSPGAVGASEGGYMAIYASIYTETVLSSAMLLTRGINFYLFMIISSAVVLVNDIRSRKEITITNQEIE